MNIIPVYFMQMFKFIILKFHMNKLSPHYYLKKNDYNKIVLANIKVVKLYLKCDFNLYWTYTLLLSIGGRIEIYFLIAKLTNLHTVGN